MKYVGTKLEESETDFKDPYVKKLQNAVHRIKKDRKMGERYMVFQEMLRDEREEGRKEGRTEEKIQNIELLLSVKNIVLNEEEMNQIKKEKNMELLKELFVNLVNMTEKEEVSDFIRKNFSDSNIAQ